MNTNNNTVPGSADTSKKTNNSNFISIVNRAMRKIDSRCDLVALIHFIETLLSKTPDKLSTGERSFYDNMLTVLKNKLSVSNLDKDKHNTLNVKLTKIMDNADDQIIHDDKDITFNKNLDPTLKMDLDDDHPFSFLRQMLQPNIK